MSLSDLPRGGALLQAVVVERDPADGILEHWLSRVPQLILGYYGCSLKHALRRIVPSIDPPRGVVGVAELVILEPGNEGGLLHRLDGSQLGRAAKLSKARRRSVGVQQP